MDSAGRYGGCKRSGYFSCCALVARVVAAKPTDRGPVGTDGGGRGRELAEGAAAINDVSAEHGQHRRDVLYPLLLHRHVVIREYRKVGELSGLDRAFLPFFVGKPGIRLRPQAQGSGAIEAI